MAEFAIEVQGEEARFTCALSEGEVLDRFALGMLQNNEIPGVLPLKLAGEAGDPVLTCSVDGLVSAAAFFEAGVSRDQVMTVLRTAAESVLGGASYLLQEDRFLFQPKMIFTDPVTGAVRLACIPADGYRSKMSLKRCIQRLLSEGVYEETEDLSYVGRLLSRLNSQDEVSAEDLLGLLQDLEEDGRNQDPERTWIDPGAGSWPESRPVPGWPEPQSQGISLEPKSSQGWPEPQQQNVWPEPQTQQGTRADFPQEQSWAPAASHEIIMDVNEETGKLEAPKKKRFGLFRKKK